MFERYTEKARRVIFFARYEASQYGSSYIETEHLLLGLLRGDQVLTRTFLGQSNIQVEIRAEIERHITRRERIPTSVAASDDSPAPHDDLYIVAPAFGSGVGIHLFEYLYVLVPTLLSYSPFRLWTRPSDAILCR